MERDAATDALSNTTWTSSSGGTANAWNSWVRLRRVMEVMTRPRRVLFLTAAQDRRGAVEGLVDRCFST